jgi:O-succinylhomoserine sulfhydrylase
MNDQIKQRGWREATRLVRGATARSSHGETSEALFMTSGYVYDSAEAAEARFKGEAEGYIYSRYANPTVAMFEERMALLEGCDAAAATASGMAAIFAAMMCLLKAGDRIVAARALFGSSLYILEDLLPRYGIDVAFVDGVELGQWRAALAQPAALVLLETPSNPTLEIIDIEAVCDLAHAAGAVVIVDNVFATPILQKPLLLGTDIVIYSATKHIDGQGRCLGGVILGSDDYINDAVAPFLKHTGPSLSPFNAWILLKGLETLELRVSRQSANAARIADFLAEHAHTGRVLYPGRADHPQYELACRLMSGGSNLIAFDVVDAAGGLSKAATFGFLNALELVDISNNLGDSKSLITHPETTTHQRLSPEARAHLGIGSGLVRLSVGLEDPDDLIGDLDAALSSAAV